MVFNFRTPSFFDESSSSVSEDTEVLGESSFNELEAETRKFSRDNFLGPRGGTSEVFSPVAEDNEVLTKFSFKELEAATTKFSQDNFLGRGGSGEVFKGRLPDGSLVAIKRFNKGWGRCEEEAFWIEVEVGKLKIQHPNILSLRGYCITKEEHLLVYPLMINNSLRSYLGPTKRNGLVQPLSWAARKQIALGVARGLEYLHHYCDPKIIHRDVHPPNILLDQEFEPVIGDFGIARIMHPKDSMPGTTTVGCSTFNDIDMEDVDNNHQRTRVLGRHGFVAPEYNNFTGMRALKNNDVFAFGNIFLSLVTGQSEYLINHPEEEGRLIMLINWVRGLMPDKLEQLMDPDLQGNHVYQEAKQLVALALQCAHDDPRQRPEMWEVVRVLEDLAGTPQFPTSNFWPRASLSRSESNSTLFHSISSSFAE